MERQFTEEQLEIIDLSTRMKRDETLKIQACAGSGKTSTLIEIAQVNSSQRFLYLAFNKSIVEEAKRKFPENVDVKTIHSLAFSKIIGQGNFKVANRHTFDNYQEILNIKNYDDFTLFNRILNEFLNSSKKNFKYQMIFDLFDAARQKKIPYTHSMYLKEFQLLRPELRGLHKYDFILLDEAQDTNSVTLDIFMENDCKKILVGDQFQNIYGFRETINALKEVDTIYEKNLTHSFRCSQSILSKACYFLNQYGGGKNIFFKSAYKEQEKDKKTSAIITRTNAAIVELIAGILIEDDIDQKKDDIDQKREEKYKLIKEPESIFASTINCYYLKNGQQDKMSKDFKWLAKLSDEELDKYAQSDAEISNALKIVDKYGVKLFDIFDMAKKMFKAKDFDTYVTNAHVSKGLEFDRVTLYGDFPCLSKLECKATEAKSSDEANRLKNQLKEETNLYYVALTRAKDFVLDKTENDFEYKNFLAQLKEEKNKQEASSHSNSLRKRA